MKDNKKILNNLKIEIGCDSWQDCQDCSSLEDCEDEFEFRRSDGLREIPKFKPFCVLCISVVMNQFGNFCLLEECRFHPNYSEFPIEILRKVSASQLPHV
ncbi:MAG: hypothetical protein ACFFBD_23065 [Candidatus Hodarchaeota archaeon]